MNERKFTPEEIVESLWVCGECGDGRCDKCAAAGQGLSACLAIFTGAAELIEAQAKRIGELEAELEKLREENRWIPTSERKPDRELEAEPKDADGKPLLGGYECIAMVEGAKRPTALWYCHMDGEGVWLDDAAESCYPVTHWKPMPKGPEVGHE